MIVYYPDSDHLILKELLGKYLMNAFFKMVV
ncbi:hypothetical protein SAMN04489761_0919 [Tenacibaculum sp. MAR_2009_124]|nr:hypothetical protein SAMN04489761_0919 [Tenacibaculum sp. MAR_2009_124]